MIKNFSLWIWLVGVQWARRDDKQRWCLYWSTSGSINLSRGKRPQLPNHLDAGDYSPAWLEISPVTWSWFWMWESYHPYFSEPTSGCNRPVPLWKDPLGRKWFHRTVYKWLWLLSIEVTSSNDALTEWQDHDRLFHHPSIRWQLLVFVELTRGTCSASWM
jgi:hypothetical protein